ncbi:uncharacterized protein BO97DRAFT_406115 [Aspergillus homomorphus CBS 101889]|uniref:Uncharacterized protein n=1 Tax=Aspergillus homomorphus (strain CBS 101889) TaxID=1450537 RepID=A0A395HYV6_ASPHC|nr:hypothetical protein BO97DRAFT_406115 [Aspergillus homomorphus CBS 101889]RAL11434.1 hypothetical protein BO97DRAFT_406115 [Aspergillus homomorphus CBS 101889]
MKRGATDWKRLTPYLKRRPVRERTRAESNLQNLLYMFQGSEQRRKKRKHRRILVAGLVRTSQASLTEEADQVLENRHVEITAEVRVDRHDPCCSPGWRSSRAFQKRQNRPSSCVLVPYARDESSLLSGVDLSVCTLLSLDPLLPGRPQFLRTLRRGRIPRNTH